MNEPNTLDEILDFTCENLQISNTNHKEAERSYKAVAEWLAATGSSLSRYKPEIYPQGSFLIGTTVFPIGRNEFDLDFVCELSGIDSSHSAVGILDTVEARLRAHATYKTMVERLKRCIRLSYANKFHMDILPAIPEMPGYGTRVLVPDRKLEDWKSSNPKGYAEWFSGRSQLYTLQLQEKRIEPLPSPQDANDKAPLQRAVQLIKRARDRYYLENPDDAPRSIVLTTLAAQAYSGTLSTAQALHEILNSIAGNPVTEVRNPANSDEVLSEQWNKNPQSLVGFRKWISWLAKEWSETLTLRGEKLSTQLFNLFGEEPVKAAYVKQAENLNKMRDRGTLGVARSGVLSGISSSAAAVPHNTFYGD